MIIEYATRKMEKILTDVRLIKKCYGIHHERIVLRLSELYLAECLQDIPDVPPPRRHKLNGDLADCWGIDYSKNHRIILRPIGEYDIKDLSSIRSIEIIDLCDYH